MYNIYIYVFNNMHFSVILYQNKAMNYYIFLIKNYVTKQYKQTNEILMVL